MPFLLLLVAFLALSPAPAFSAAGPWAQEEEIRVRLVSESDTTGNQKNLRLGIEVQLASGWHTYWRSPGEAGLPPEWKLEDGNIASARFLYPAPTRYSTMGMDTIGYEDDVLLPVELSLKDPAQPLALKSTIDIMICRELCLLKHFPLTLDLPTGGAAPSSEQPLIEKAFASLPKKLQESTTKIAGLERGRDFLRLTFLSEQPFDNPDLFIENEEGLAFGKPKIDFNEDRTLASFTLHLLNKPEDKLALKNLAFAVTMTNGTEAVEQTIDPTFMPVLPPSDAFPRFETLLSFVFFAFLGGFILNLTPCVLPVLSLKVLSVISHGGNKNQAVRHSFLMTAAGIVFSFLLLAGGTMVLQEAGKIIGWGMQFQHPLFLVFLSVILTFFAANLWGFFEIPLPRFLADRMDPTYHPKLAGDFAAGGLATLLATPCTAPFLGTAIGFALAAGPIEILVIFTALGLGMALPYILVAFFPRLATALPKPGAWMERLKHILGWALALTVLWLLFVLAVQIPLENALLVATSLVGILAFLLLYKKKGWRLLLRAGLPFLLLLSFAVTYLSQTASISTKTDAHWQIFDEVVLDKHLREGKVVFVDITADWCINCKANKKFTLDREDVQKALFEDPTVIALQGDWTTPNPAIASFLKRHNRYGIPFNAVFGPAAPEGIVLSEILTPDTVLKALHTAKTPTPPSATETP